MAAFDHKHLVEAVGTVTFFQSLVLRALAELLRRELPQPIRGYQMDANNTTSNKLADQLEQAADRPDAG